ncbi:MAG TPA: hypothetical protein VGK99_17735 [Acidobacteriota bacterium]|jgi:hypothetical protein
MWNAIDGIRKVGNIGTHMEKDVNVIVDVDPGEAEKLLRLIEVLVDEWYVRRENKKKRIADVTALAAEKDKERGL